MHRSHVFQLEQFTDLASQMGRCAPLLAQGTASRAEDTAAPLSRAERNLRWRQQLPGEFGCVGKLHSQLQLQRRAGFTAGAHLPSPPWAQASPASGGVSSVDRTSQKRFTTAVGLVYTACAMKQITVRSWEHPSGQRGSPGSMLGGQLGDCWPLARISCFAEFTLPPAVNARTGNHSLSWLCSCATSPHFSQTHL